MHTGKLSAVTFEVEVGALVEDSRIARVLRDWPEEEPLDEKEYADPCEAAYAFEREDLASLLERIARPSSPSESRVVVGSYAAVNRLEWEGGALANADRLATRMRERGPALSGEGTVILGVRRDGTFLCERECGFSHLPDEVDEMARNRGASPEAPSDRGCIPISAAGGGVVYAIAGKPAAGTKFPHGDGPRYIRALAGPAGNVFEPRLIRLKLKALGVRVEPKRLYANIQRMVAQGMAEKESRGRYRILR